MSRIRVQQAKHVLDATNIYCQNVNWTIQRSNYKDVSSKVTTVTESGEHGTKGMRTVSTWMRAAEHTPRSTLHRQCSWRRFDGHNT